ncbi:22517_t:CDS:2, partial [Gigaspora rosea]
VGDLHGDYEQTLKVLKMSRIWVKKKIGNNGMKPSNNEPYSKLKLRNISSFGTTQNRVHEFSSKSYIDNLLLTTFQIASIVENDTLFVHGGIDIEWAIENINILGKELVNKMAKMLSRENPTITWNAMNVMKEEAILEILKVKRMLIGHTPLSNLKCSESGNDDNNENANKIIKNEL